MAREEKINTVRLNAVQYGIVGVFLLLILGLWRLQITGNEKYAAQAEGNSIREVTVLAPRGKLLDREGRVIVDNYPSFSALLERDHLKDVEPQIDPIAAGLGLTGQDVRDRLKRMAAAPASQPLMLKEDLTPNDLAFVEAHRNEFPQIDTIVQYRRLYPKNGFAAHLIGYVGEVTEEMLNNSSKYRSNVSGDVVGQSGVEQQYDQVLRGKNGKLQVEVNSRGKVLRQLGEISPEPGKNLKLTIDLDIQKAAEEALEGHNGAIVAMDPRNGEVLAMVSRPVFDPNLFAIKISRDDWNKLITDPAKPMLNKALQAQLAPGSVFKIIMSVAGLEEGVAQNMHVYCGGSKIFYGRVFKCWIAAKHSGHGDVEISKAIYQSCDTFFYTLGEKLGISAIAKYAMALGLGQRTRVDLPGEVTGVMPSEEWKIRNFKQKWYAGETISVSIGQGAVATTPIQLARTIGGIASGGVLQRPHVVFVEDMPQEQREVWQKGGTEVRVPISPQNVATITDAMSNVVGPLGTAPQAHIQDVDFAGKTGSAQTVSNDARKILKGSEFKDNGWFAGFTPRRNPEIVVSVLVEQGEHGSLAAGIASKVIKAYADKKRRLDATKVAGSKPGPLAMAGYWGRPDLDASDREGLRGGDSVAQ